ncbi:MAG: hypothetical protein Q4D78_03395 [Neisseria zoodegmatis]|uniref:hypothetical protein n=2 Tax=Neisseria TaxID=482 RepID=UPI0026F275C2|nr:hypothetical protein [Neisseria zoodegmatis]MDO5069231.1 hypothetical protein [Neisseria zoodegmatis]
MIRSLNKIINSSVSMAFVGITSWATAYCYGWGQALFHGYPWWHVSKGPDNVARSLAYVCITSLVLAVGYGIGYLLLRAVKKSSWFEHIGFLRIFVLLNVLFFPIAVECYLLRGYMPLKILLAYLGVSLLFSAVFHRIGNRFQMDMSLIRNEEQYSPFFTAFIFLYFTALAFCIGYTRPYFRTTYDKMVFENKPYYILASSSDVYIMGEKIRDNHEFVFFNHQTLKGYKIDVVEMPKYFSNDFDL